MKKILLLMAIILPFVLTSCGDDKPIPLKKQLIGSWADTIVILDNLSFTDVMVFNSDNSGRTKVILTGSDFNESSKIERFIWSLKGNVLTIKYSDDTLEYEIYIKDDVLHMKHLSEPDYSNEKTYTRYKGEPYY